MNSEEAEVSLCHSDRSGGICRVEREQGIMITVMQRLF